MKFVLKKETISSRQQQPIGNASSILGSRARLTANHPHASYSSIHRNICCSSVNSDDSSEEQRNTNSVDQAERSEVTALEFPAVADPSAPLKTSGLHRSSLSGGVQNATHRCELPSPAVAVRNLVEQAQFAHLCTIMSGMHHRRAGYPFGTVVDFVADGAGYPIFSLSPLAIQTRNIMEDPRCSLVMQMPGWTGLANARVTMFGDVYMLPKDMQGQAEQIFQQKLSVDGKNQDGGWVSGNATYFRMNRIQDIYFVGGFGTVQWVDIGEYTVAQPDDIVLQNPNQTLKVLNEKYSEAIRQVLPSTGHSGIADDAAFISIDKLGADVRVRRGGEYSVERVGFDNEVQRLDDAVAAMKRLVQFLEKKMKQPQ